MSPARAIAAFDRMYRAGARACVAVVLAVVTASVSAPALAGPPAEAQVRAAYLLNFMRYTRWPTTSDGPLVVAVLGTPEQAALLRDLASRAGPIDGRPVVVRALALASIPPAPAEANSALATAMGQAQVLYVGPSHQAWSRAVGAVASRRPVLTVGPGRPFLEGGGMIGMYLDAGHVRFDVNVQAIKASALDVSARLLVLARPAGG